MSLATVSRRQIPSLRCISRLQTQTSRHASSSAATGAAVSKTQPKPNIQSHETLPPAKMRALISLYHQTETWITPENLLERIDAAFVPPITAHSVALPSQESITYNDLSELSTSMRAEPKMAQLESDSQSRYLPGSYASWSMGRNMSKRETKVFEALYGVEVENDTQAVKVLPGLEVLEEMKEKFARYRAEDKEDEDHVGDLLEV